MRFADIVKRERLIDVRANPFFFDAAQDVAHPNRYLLRLVPHVAQVQPKHTAILVEQRKRMKPKAELMRSRKNNGMTTAAAPSTIRTSLNEAIWI